MQEKSTRLPTGNVSANTIDDYIEREVKPYAPDAWVDYSKTKKGYEIPFTRHFYKYEELGDAEETLLEIQSLGERIQSGINRLFAEEV
jgi:type I restriction enzyme M protein